MMNFKSTIMVKRIVTTKDFGAKVVRGRDWQFFDQDEGSEYGVIIPDKKEEGWVRVEWVDKEGKYVRRNSYRVGADGKYDLYYYESESLPMEQYSIDDIIRMAESKYKIGGKARCLVGCKMEEVLTDDFYHCEIEPGVDSVRLRRGGARDFHDTRIWIRSKTGVEQWAEYEPVEKPSVASVIASVTSDQFSYLPGVGATIGQATVTHDDWFRDTYLGVAKLKTSGREKINGVPNLNVKLHKKNKNRLNINF
jgi:hypothetical protein